MCCAPFRIELRAGCEHHITDEALIARRVFADDDGAFLDSRVRSEHRLDLTELDAIAAHFHLGVTPAEEVYWPSARKRAMSPVR